MEDKKRTRILGIMCKGIAISLLVLYVSLAFFSFFIRFSFVCSFVSSYLVVFRPVLSYFGLVRVPPRLARVPPGPPGASQGQFVAGTEQEEKRKSRLFSKRMEHEWSTNGLDERLLLP